MDNDDFVLTWTEARELVQSVEDAFGAADLAAISEGFTEDAVARFADFQMHGKREIMAFLTARFAHTQGYKLTKKLQVLTGNRLASTWDASWTDGQTGKSMLGDGTRSGSCTRTAHRGLGCDIQSEGKGRPALDAGGLSKIAAISLMRRQDRNDLKRYRLHWLDVHGPLECAFPGLRPLCAMPRHRLAGGE